MSSLYAVLATPPDPEPIASVEAWWQRYQTSTSVLSPPAHLPIDQAILGGFLSDRVGYAFASGYQAALRALIPDLPSDRLASLCMTERGGGHPRAVETRLDADPSQERPDAYRLNGHKRWATLCAETGVLLVAASTGTGEGGQNRLRLVRVESQTPGVTLHAMPAPPFTAEIGHAEVELEGVLVAERDIYPGDGFARYVRPFRTVEDIHVFAAIFAYLVREIRLHHLAPSLAERIAGLLVALRALAAGDPSAPETHLALAGVRDLAGPLIDELSRVWAKTESPSHARWENDRLVLTVGAAAREKRRARAWERLLESEVKSEVE
jgi:acyl-CoA dehydrogenase